MPRTRKSNSRAASTARITAPSHTHKRDHPSMPHRSHGSSEAATGSHHGIRFGNGRFGGKSHGRHGGHAARAPCRRGRNGSRGGYVGRARDRRGSLHPARQHKPHDHVCDGRDAERAYRKQDGEDAHGNGIEVEVFRHAGTYAGYRFVVGAMSGSPRPPRGLLSLAFRTACYACEEPTS